MIKKPFAATAEQLFLGVHTAGRMQPRQLAGIMARKARGVVLPRLPIDFDRWYEWNVPEDPPVQLSPLAENTATLRRCLDDSTRNRYRIQAQQAAKGTPTFLNRTLRVVDGENVNWYDERFDELPIDWSLKLYGFKPLSWLCLGFDSDDDDAPKLQSTFDGWVHDWQQSVEIGEPQYLRRAWTPWAVSLRIINWSRYLAWREQTAGNGGDRELIFRRELYKNALFLQNHVEWDVGGNHLIENGAALAIAGLVFEKQSWIDTGLSILSDAGMDQFLDDGFHFERSPMYHVLTLTRYLTVCDLLERDGRPVPTELQRVADKATDFLRFLRPPNGNIPLMNDSVYGEALPLDSCLRYATTLGYGNDVEEWETTRDGGPSGNGAADSYWLRNDAGSMLVDGGPVGPKHLPGHSHSDTLSVLLWLDGYPIVTDTGTFGYSGDDRRQYARGVRGHNTVQVGATEPIALGGKYLMGPRVEPTTRFVDGDVSLFEGRYEATPYRSQIYSHHRSVYSGDYWWLVHDTVCGHDNDPVRSRLHLHPDVDASMESTGRIHLEYGEGRQQVFVYPLEATRGSVTPGQYFPQFGTSVSRSVLELHADDTGMGLTTSGFFVTPQAFDEIAVGMSPDGYTVTEIDVAGDEYRLPNTHLVRQ